ncbi:MAG: hypothetical protein GXO58_03500, partial [Thermodesulfobacteria bacterium]|nr:hypothetical protein [Thermodesulfobacteriota bacterium]
LAQNHIDHQTRMGHMRLFGQRISPNDAIFTATSLDKGPGLDSSLKLGAGRTRGKGLGLGLKTVERLADEFAMCSGRLGEIPCPDLLFTTDEIETVMCASFFHPGKGLGEIPVEFSLLTRPAKGSQFCGDGVYLLFEFPYLLLVIMDALGKGKEAAEVTEVAKNFLSMVPASTDPHELLLAIGQKILGARGLMIQALRLNLERAELKAVTAGDIGHFIFLDGEERFLSGHKGLIGQVNSRSFLMESSFRGFREIMGIAFTDGLGTIPQIRFQQVLMEIPALIWTNYLFPFDISPGGMEDDATIVVWKWKT